MTSRVIPVAPFCLTVFGATGDLARRKLVPALFHRDFDGQLPEAATILGAARRPMSRDQFVSLARDAIVEHIPASQTGGPELDRFLTRLQFVAIDAEGEDGWAELASAMAPFAGDALPKRASEEPSRVEAVIDAASVDTSEPKRSASSMYGRTRRYCSAESTGRFTAFLIIPSAR